jgi:hypothetical protein
MSPKDEALHGRIRAMQARGALMVDITAALGITKEKVWCLCVAYHREPHMVAAAQREPYRQTAERIRLEEPELAYIDLPYVDLLEAVRVVVRLMPDGEALASRMTDGWLRGGGRLLYDSDEYTRGAIMAQIYGSDWRTVRPRVVAAYERAVRILERVLSSGRVPGIGVSAVARKNGQRPIEPHEWASRQLHIRDGLLATPPGKWFDTHPRILDVLVSVEDLKRECAAIIAPPKAGSHAHKRQAVDKAIRELGVSSLLAMAVKARVHAIINRVAEQNGGLSVCPRYVRERLSEAQRL